MILKILDCWDCKRWQPDAVICPDARSKTRHRLLFRHNEKQWLEENLQTIAINLQVSAIQTYTLLNYD